jgi:integrase
MLVGVIRWRIKHINEFGRHIYLIRTFPKSKSSVRFIPLPDFLVELLEPLQSDPEAYFLSGEEDHLIESRYLLTSTEFPTIFS